MGNRVYTIQVIVLICAIAKDVVFFSIVKDHIESMISCILHSNQGFFFKALHKISFLRIRPLKLYFLSS